MTQESHTYHFLERKKLHVSIEKFKHDIFIAVLFFAAHN